MAARAIPVPREREERTKLTTALDRSRQATQARGSDMEAPALDTILASLDESKAEDIVTIDIRGKSALGDAMIIASGRSNRHVASICDRLLRDLKDAGHGAPVVEGLEHGDWVLLDDGDVIVHVFRPEVREFYNLERMWSGEGEAGTVH